MYRTAHVYSKHHPSSVAKHTQAFKLLPFDHLCKIDVPRNSAAICRQTSLITVLVVFQCFVLPHLLLSSISCFLPVVAQAAPSFKPHLSKQFFLHKPHRFRHLYHTTGNRHNPHFSSCTFFLAQKKKSNITVHCTTFVHSSFL